MPSKKKKYNARFPAGRIKKIMQTDEEVGKVAQAVPVIISRTLELFVESLLTKAMQITSAKNAKTLSPSHMKQCILSEQRFDFLKDLVDSVQDTSNGEDELTHSSSVLASAPAIIAGRRKSDNNIIKQEKVQTEERGVKEDLVIKEETFIKEENPIKSRHIVANCSTLHLNPNFYSEIPTDQKASIHQPPLLHAESPRITPSPQLVMDEDYDT